MTSLSRAQWALFAGLLAGGTFLVLGAVSDGGSGPMGIEPDAWALALAAVAGGLAVQLLLNHWNATRREADLMRTAVQLREVSAELDRLARTDALTSVANRRALFDLMGVEFRRSRRYGRDLSVLMLDLDHFKQVNDRWGHPFGDEVLREVSRLVLRNIRESDILGRYGGEEFAVVLPEANAEQAVLVGEKLRHAIEAHTFRMPDASAPGEPTVRLTISIGVASTPVDQDQDEVELFSRADQALYEAKRTGRNRVVLYAKPTPTPAAQPSGGGDQRPGLAPPEGA